ILLTIAELLAGGDAQLLFDNVDAAGQLADRVLDLQARVHLDEVERTILIEELHRAGAFVPEAGERRHGGRGEPLARRCVERRRRRLLYELLMSALQRAVALAEMDDIAAAVAEQLHLDMPRPVEKALEIDRIVAKPGARLGLCQRQHLGKV